MLNTSVEKVENTYEGTGDKYRTDRKMGTTREDQMKMIEIDKRDKECLWWTHKKSPHRGEKKNISELDDKSTKNTQTKTEKNKNGKKKIGKIEHPRAVAQCQIINIHIIEISEEEQGKKGKKKLKDMMTKNFPK